MAGFQETNQQSATLMASDDPGAAAQAEKLWRSFLRDPACVGDDRALSLASLARVVAERGHFKDAVNVAWEAVETAASPFAKVATWSEYNSVLYKGRRDYRTAEALAVIEELGASFPEMVERFRPMVLVGRARLLFLSGRVDEAAGVSVRATVCAEERAEAKPEAYGIRSDCLHAMGDRDGAIISAMRGVAASSGVRCKTEGLLKLFHLHLESGEFGEATAFASQAMELVPAASRRVVADVSRAIEDLRRSNPEAAASLQAVLWSTGSAVS